MVPERDAIKDLLSCARFADSYSQPLQGWRMSLSEASVGTLLSGIGI